MKMFVLSGAFAGVLLGTALPVAAQAPPTPAPPRRPPVVSPEVAADRRVTFRLRAPTAKEVKLAGQWQKEKPALARDAEGLWSVTVGPVEAGVWEYSYEVDGLSVIDPANPHIKPQRSPTRSILEVPGSPPLLSEFQDVPHGAVHVVHYRSKVTGSVRRLHVYTPPGYEARTASRYPTLYLFHGNGDNDGAWSVHGRANFIADNLIAQGKAKPMIIVMTDGHAVAQGNANNLEMFRRDLLEEVLPLVETRYRVRRDAQSRAIVGLSMGGQQALTIGLERLDTFAWVGGFSAAAPPAESMSAMLADAKAVARKLKWLWIGCGKDDFLLKRNEAFVTMLKDKGVPHIWRLTDGGHTWPVWRTYLAEVLPALFGPAPKT